MATNKLLARQIIPIENHPALVSDVAKIRELREKILEGDVVIAKKVCSEEILREVKKYLVNIGKNSLPNYQPIQEGSPNSHRLNLWDERAYVKGCFHQFSFFPWNQDMFEFFRVFKDVFIVKNLINNIPANKFLGMKSEEGCIARLSFQFYPKGEGVLHTHSDPVDHHQLTAPIMLLSSKGQDYKQGGGYVLGAGDKKIMLDDLMGIGDVAYYNAQIPHGVDAVDPGGTPNRLAFEGRWMVLFAVNKLMSNTSISNAQDLG